MTTILENVRARVEEIRTRVQEHRERIRETLGLGNLGLCNPCSGNPGNPGGLRLLEDVRERVRARVEEVRARVRELGVGGGVLAPTGSSTSSSPKKVKEKDTVKVGKKTIKVRFI